MSRRSFLLPFFVCSALAAAPSVKSFRMPSGLEVRLEEDHERPLLRLEFQTTWDRAEIPADKQTLALFLGRLMAASGVAGMDREAFRRSMEESALRSSFRYGPGYFRWSMLATSQNLDPAFRNLALAVMRPSLNESLVEAERKKWLREIEDLSPRKRAELQFLCGVDPEAVAPVDEETLPSIQLQELDRMRRSILRPDHAVLVLYGDINLDQARQAALLHFGAWGPAPEPPFKSAESSSQTAAASVKTWVVPDAPAGMEIHLGSAAKLGGSEACEFALSLLQRELDGGAGVADWTVSSKGLVGVYPSATPAAEALKDVQLLLDRLRARVWTASEVAWAGLNRKARLDATFLHPESFLESLVRKGKVGSEPSEGANAADVQKCIQTWLAPSALRLLLLGARVEDVQALEKTEWAPVRAAD